MVNIPMSLFQSSGKALPLIALQYHEVRCNLQIAEEFLPPGLEVDANLHLLYFFLDSDERRNFAQDSHEYLMCAVHYAPVICTEKNVQYVKSLFFTKANTLF